MFPDKLQHIQDIAGETSPVSPFAKSTPKDKYAILSYSFDNEGKLVAIRYEDFVAYKGKKLDFSEHLYKSGNYSFAQHVYGKEGNLWKITWSYYRDGKKQEHEQKISHKYQKIDDAYVGGYLGERTYIGEKSKQSFIYSIDYFKRGCIYFEWLDEKDDVVVRIIEKYDSERRLLSQHNFEAKLSNQSCIRTNEMLYFHYSADTNVVTQIDRSLNDDCSTFFEKLVFSDIDEKGNWLKVSCCKYEKVGGDEKLIYSESREIAYDESSARELKIKFESLRAERSAGDEYFENK